MILFDFDGVLADSKATCLEACAMAAARQSQQLDMGDDAFSDLDPLTFEALAERCGLDPAAFALAVANHVQGAADPAQPFPGVREMIATLAQTHGLGIVSASNSAVIERFLAANGLADFFAHVVGGERPGDKAAKLAEICATSTDRHHVFVGDAVSDMRAGRSVGAIVAAVTWGWQPRHRLEAEAPDIVAQSPEELGRIISATLTQLAAQDT